MVRWWSGGANGDWINGGEADSRVKILGFVRAEDLVQEERGRIERGRGCVYRLGFGRRVIENF